MTSAGLISIWRTALVRKAILVHGIETQVPNWSIRRSFAPKLVGVGSRTRRVCAQAVETSSTPNGTAGRQPFVEPNWLLSISDGDNLQGNSDGDEVHESTCERSWPSSQTKYQKQSGALYYIVICTAKDDKSSLSEPNAGILLSIIGENGNAIMQKIPGTKDSDSLHSGEANFNPECSLRFQRGAVDVVTIEGPDLGRLAALWIAPGAGTWRLEKASVAILPLYEKLDIEERLSSGNLTSWVMSDELTELASADDWKGVFHLFESNEELLGNDAWLGAAELKPSFIQETSDAVGLREKLLQLSPERPRSSQGVAKLREDGMKEYENLKLSLLGFSSFLVVAGTASLAALGNRELAEGFAFGGVGGFMYLLLLQRAVDQLPSAVTDADILVAQRDLSILSSVENKEKRRQQVEGTDGETGTVANSQEQERAVGHVDSSSPERILFGGGIGLRGRIALVAGVALILGRLAEGGAMSTISPPQLLAGVLGFLTSRIAVLLAALKPTSSAGEK